MDKNANKEETLLDEDATIPIDWKKELPGVVRSGNIDRLEELMESEDFDINTTWFQENLLMIAIRAGQTEMAEFLIDNKINYNFTRRVLDYKSSTKQIDCYVISCRQLAYDHQMTDIVHLIDQKSEQLFSFIKLRQRTPRIHQSKKLAVDDSAETSNSCLDLSSAERSKLEKKSLETRKQTSSNFFNKGLNLHRFTPDLILHERRKRTQVFLPLYKNDSPRNGVLQKRSSSACQNGVRPSTSMLNSFSNSSLWISPQWDASSDWSLRKKNDKNNQRAKTGLTTRY